MHKQLPKIKVIKRKNLKKVDLNTSHITSEAGD